MSVFEKKELGILNLFGPLAPKLETYLSNRSIKLVEEGPEITHIFVRGSDDVMALAEKFNVRENNISLIALSEITNIKEFLYSNGRIVFDPLWLSSSVGTSILDKFFQEYSSIDKSRGLPSFTEIGSFKVSNPFSTGEYADHLVFHALENRIAGLAVKTFFDHIMMFIAGLKAQGKTGWPVEVTYGILKEVFALQLTFNTKEFIVQEMLACMSEVKSRKAEDYLINLAIHSSDFFDFTYLNDVNKVTITGIWTQDQRYKYENRGIVFSELSSKALVTSYPLSGISISNLEEIRKNDISHKVILPSSVQVLTEEDDKRSVSDLTEGVVDKIIVKGSNAEKTHREVISGTADEIEGNETVKGEPTGPEKISLVKGQSTENESSEVVSGEFEENEFKTVIKGSSQEEDEVKVTIPSDKNIQGGAFQLISSGYNQEDDSNKAFIVKGSNNTEKELETNMLMAKGGAAQTVERPKSIFDFMVKSENSPGEDRNKSTIQKVITSTKELGELQGKQIFTNERQDESTEALNETEKELIAQAKVLAFENHTLKVNIKKLLSELKSSKEARSRLAEINQKLTENGNLGEDNNKVKIENAQRENSLMLEIENLKRQLKLKDILVESNRRIASIAMEKKEEELVKLKTKLEELNPMLGDNHSQTQSNHISTLEKENVNLNKMLELYKMKVTTLATNIEQMSNKNEGENIKEENRKLNMMNIQINNELEIVQRELEKLHVRSGQDSLQLANLKKENLRLEQELKKSSFETKKNTDHSVSKVQHEVEVKKLTSELNRMDYLLRESQRKAAELESKLADALKTSKTAGQVSGEEQSKGRVLQLETSLKKLTQDLVESRNQMAELKKEANKQRQEKTALQNKLDQAKKNIEKHEKVNNKSGKSSGKAA